MTPPLTCKHDQGERAEVIEDGKGNVIGYHYRCTKCHIMVRTEML